jgi:hypothetical protein
LRGRREPAAGLARGHAADEHAAVAGVTLHAHAIAQHRAAGKRRRRIDGDDRDRFAGAAKVLDQAIDDRRLAGARAVPVMPTTYAGAVRAVSGSVAAGLRETSRGRSRPR